MALVVEQTPEALADLGVPQRKLIGKAHPTTHEGPSFGAVRRHAAVECPLYVSVQSLPLGPNLLRLLEGDGSLPLAKSPEPLGAVVPVGPLLRFLHLDLLENDLVEEPIGFRSVRPGLRMLDRNQHAIQSYAPLP